MKPQQEKPATFDGYADDYASLIRDPIRDTFAGGSRFFFDRKMQVIRDFLNRAETESSALLWLDIGCGQGDLLRLGKSYFKHAAGCDPSHGMLKSCADLDVRHQPAPEVLPYDSRTFDFVTAVCVYHHVPPDRRSLLTAEAFRVLKPGGIFCIIEHNPINPVTRLIVSRTKVDAGVQLLTAQAARLLLSTPASKVLGSRYFLLFPERLKSLVRIEDSLRALPLGGQYAVFAQRC
ncbi:MAG TPA: class I SAM-dependent methyltransferase [Terriglobia bacterium]|jgi:SAM-dependent methyltransferase